MGRLKILKNELQILKENNFPASALELESVDDKEQDENEICSNITPTYENPKSNRLSESSFRRVKSDLNISSNLQSKMESSSGTKTYGSHHSDDLLVPSFSDARNRLSEQGSVSNLVSSKSFERLSVYAGGPDNSKSRRKTVVSARKGTPITSTSAEVEKLNDTEY